MSQIDQKYFNRFFPKQRPILYQPAFALVFGSVNAGVLLSQLLYWHSLGRLAHGWIYKTAKEMQAETGLSYEQQKTAIKLLGRHGVLETKLAQVPAKRHFRLDLVKLEEVLRSSSKSHELVYWFPPISKARSPHSKIAATPPTITETTQEITHENTSAGHDGNALLRKKASLMDSMDLNRKLRPP